MSRYAVIATMYVEASNEKKADDKVIQALKDAGIQWRSVMSDDYFCDENGQPYESEEYPAMHPPNTFP